MKNIQLFDRDGSGSKELTEVLGMISADITFDKWAPYLPLGVRDVSAIVGREVVENLSRYYMEGPTEDLPEYLETPLMCLQQAVALFTWLKIIPTLDAQHDDTGRSRRLGENEKGLTALQEWKDENNILHLAYEAVDALIEALELEKAPFWISAPCRGDRSRLLISTKEEFDRFYRIGSHRLFVTLLPMLAEVQDMEIVPRLGKYLQPVLDGDPLYRNMLGDHARRALALLTMAKAVMRLPVEVIPEGVVQISQTAPVNQRNKAEQAARQSVAASLEKDAASYLSALGELVAALDDAGADYKPHVPGPIVHSKGMSF